MTADNETAATEAEAPVLQPEDLSGPDAGRDLAAGSAPADGPESHPDAAEAPQETPEPAAEAEPQPAPEPAPRVSLRELEARISVPLQCAAEPHWPDLMKRAAADQEPWAELTDGLIAAGHAEMPDRQFRVWFGDKAPAAAA